MLLIDISGIFVATLYASINEMDSEDVNENLLRHFALNMLRNVRLRYKQDKNVVIACDGSIAQTWRKDVFPYYKAKRKENRDASGLNWPEIFEILNKITNEIDQYFPYKVLKIERAEADDIIGTLTKEYYQDEQVTIISRDKDFKQLQRYHGVKQYDPLTKIEMTCDNPMAFLQEHIIRGDSGDGIPNFLSQDDCFVQKIRQKSIMQKKLETWLTQDYLEIVGDDKEMLRNWKRNEQLIDLTFTPKDIQHDIIATYESMQSKKGNIFNYCMKFGLRNLMDSISDF